MTSLPILLSIPHGGVKNPPELNGHLCITKKDLFDDLDPFVQDIYDLGCKVRDIITTPIARTFIDLNRSPKDLPPRNPDGLIKSCTCYKKPIYDKGKEPDEVLSEILIKKYYEPYHQKIQKLIKDPKLILGLDCHSMATYAPNISPDGKEKKRPSFCLSNQDGKTSSKKMIELLATCVSKTFSIDKNDIRLNDPFHGGYITKTYGNRPIPWIQIEMNRDMYLIEPWFDENALTVEKSHLKNLNMQFENCLELFFSEIKNEYSFT